MPAWNPKANDIFLAALELDSTHERRAYLERVCADNVGLKAEVESLLAADGDAGSFLSVPASVALVVHREVINAILSPQSPAEGPATRIGPYRLLEQIGEGGFGIVYMAEQERPVRRKVALKILKPGMDTHEIIARFESERQALALMDHPNIAKVLDAGTISRGIGDDGLRIESETPAPHLQSTIRNPQSSGCPFFVMELVRGLPITKYCDNSQLRVEKRLELFIQVCNAVQHAHQKGIVHRDLKPSNVMVTLQDGRPVPKVIDFGVAKAMSGQLTEQTLFTAYGALIGTPAYMSPEQAALNSQDIDTRSDIYSLGVLLYELLTGTTPFEKERLKQASFDEMRRIIREEEPETVSQRLKRTRRVGSAPENEQTSGGQSPPCATFHPSFFRFQRVHELDWIVAKSLEKERNRRYETTSAFAADIQRYLNHQPVQACPPSALYLLRKFAVRHRTAILTVGAIFLATVVGLGLASWQAVRAARADRLALETATQLAAASREKALQKQALEAEAARAKQQAFYIALAQLTDRSLRRPAGWTWQNLSQIESIAPAAPDESSRYQLRSQYARTVVAHDVRSVKTLLERCDLYALAWSPDGSRVAAGSNVCSRHEPAVRIFSGAMLEFERELTITGIDEARIAGGAPEGVRSLVFSSDSQRLIVGTRHGRVLVYDTRTGEVLHDWQAHQDYVCAMLHLSDDTLITACRDGSIRYWRLGEETPFHEEDADGEVNALLSARGWLFANANSLLRYRLPAFADKPDMLPHQPMNAKPTRVAITPDRQALLLVSKSHIDVVDIYRGAVARSFANSHRSQVHDSVTAYAVVAPHARWALTTDAASLHLWDFVAGRLISKLNLVGRTRVIGEFDPAFPRMVASGDERLQLLEIFSDPIAPTVLCQSTPVKGMDLTRDGRVLAVVAPRNDRSSATVFSAIVSFLDKPWTGVPDQNRLGRDSGQELSLSPSGDMAAIASSGWNYLFVVDRNSATPPRQFNIVKPEYAHFAPDGRRVWLTGDSPTEFIPGQRRAPDTLISLGLPEFQPTFHWLNAGSARRLRVSEFKGLAVGRGRVVAGSMDQTVRWFDADTGQLQGQHSVAPYHPCAIALTSDESTAIVGLLDGGVLLLDLATGRAGPPLSAHAEFVSTLAIADTGMVVTGGNEGLVRFWQLASNALQPLFELDASHFPVKKLAITSDGRLLAILYDGEAGVRLLHLDQLFERLSSLNLTPPARGAVVGGSPP